MRLIKISKEVLVDLYIDQRKTIPEVATLLGVGNTTVHRKLIQFGIPTRNASMSKLPADWDGVCKDCGKSTDTLQGRRVICKPCADKESYVKHKEKRLQSCKIYRNNHPEQKEKTKEWHKNNPEKIQIIRKRWSSVNSFKRTQALENAMPPWLTEEERLQIKNFYINCPHGYHVDHIVPLQGKTVCGLHVLWNLQYLPASENLKKSNKLGDY